MGNSSSSSGRSQHDDSVDYGALSPQGVYTGPQDWNQSVVSQLIVSRKLAPFYRPLDDYDDSWDDDQILAARKESSNPESADSVTRIEPSTGSTRSKRPSALKEPAKPEAQVYRGAVECPICFLYYPPNINHSRCCDQAICTECFVQIKRTEPTTTHLVSEPAACPYCVQENFGIVYTPPPWRAGLGSEHGPSADLHPPLSPAEPASPPAHKRRQKSYGAASSEVVLIDHIRPDWEAKLEAVRAAVARRANRRIIMRQVGDRLIPVGITSGRVHALSPEEAATASTETGSRRSRRRGHAGGDPLEHLMGMSGQDLEELMLMEAMRISLLEHEEHERKEAEERKKRMAAEAATLSVAAAGGDSSAPSSISGSSPDGPSTHSTAQTAPAPSSSTHKRSSLPPTSSSSSLSASPPWNSNSPSPSPAHRSNDAPTFGRRTCISRQRTPPPPPPAPNLPLSEENQTAWRNRSGEPRAFSTLRAALTATSTAAAVLGTSDTRMDGSSSPTSLSPEPDSDNLADSTRNNSPRALQVKVDEGRSNANAEEASIPMITIHKEDGQMEGKISSTSANEPGTSFSDSITSPVPSSNPSETSAAVPNGSYGNLDLLPPSTASTRLRDEAAPIAQHIEQISS